MLFLAIVNFVNLYEKLRAFSKRMKSYYLNSHKCKDDFDAKDSTINVIAKEEVVDLTRVTCFLKHVNKVIELSMQISDNDDWLSDLHQVRFLT